MQEGNQELTNQAYIEQQIVSLFKDFLTFYKGKGGLDLAQMMCGDGFQNLFKQAALIQEGIVFVELHDETANEYYHFDTNGIMKPEPAPHENKSYRLTVNKKPR